MKNISDAKKLRNWKIKAFIGTWIAYAGFYLCRRNYSFAQPEFMKEFGWSGTQVGIIISGYLAIYAAGQIINGVIGDKWGGRLILGIGLISSAVINFIFGFSATITMMFVLYSLNGYFQSTGWPACIKIMTNWVPINQRGKVMPWWGTCYQIGDILATKFPLVILGLSSAAVVYDSTGNAINFTQWRYVFWVPSIVLLGISIFTILLIRNKPEDVGLCLPEDKKCELKVCEIPQKSALRNTIEVLKNKYVLILGFSYFGVKFVRYTFWFWLPTYMRNSLGYSAKDPFYDYTNIIFPIMGFLGTLFAGWASDKFFNLRRAPISAIMLLAMAGVLVFMLIFTHNPICLLIAVGLIGFMLYGPDFVISGIAVMDFGSKEHAATAAGLVNGIGAFGPAIMGITVGLVSDHYGWVPVFYILIGLSVLSSILISTMWNAKGEN